MSGLSAFLFALVCVFCDCSGLRDFEPVFLGSFHEWGSIERIFLFDLPQPGRDLQEEAFEVTAARFVPVAMWVSDSARKHAAQAAAAACIGARGTATTSLQHVLTLSLCTFALVCRPKRAIAMLATPLLAPPQNADAWTMDRLAAQSALTPSLHHLLPPPPLPLLLPPLPLRPRRPRPLLPLLVSRRSIATVTRRISMGNCPACRCHPPCPPPLLPCLLLPLLHPLRRLRACARRRACTCPPRRPLAVCFS